MVYVGCRKFRDIIIIINIVTRRFIQMPRELNPENRGLVLVLYI